MPATSQGAAAALSAAGAGSATGSSFWLAAGTLWFRELRGFYRQRSRILGTLSTPLLFWFVLGSGFGSSLRNADGSYLSFFFPGMVALTVLFTSILANISLIEDRREGFLLGVLVAPVSRLSLVLGKVGGATTLGAIQGALLLPLAPLAGIPLGLADLPLVFALLLLLSGGLTALGFCAAWWVNSVQGFHSVMNLLLMPMWLLSGSVFPAAGTASWMAWIARLNPLSYGVTELRRLLGAPVAESAASSVTCWTVLAAFAALALLAAWHRATRTEAEHLA